MAANAERTAVESHTEYSHGRFRCLGCGEIVPTGDGRAEQRLCDDCARTRTP